MPAQADIEQALRDRHRGPWRLLRPPLEARASLDALHDLGVLAGLAVHDAVVDWAQDIDTALDCLTVLRAEDELTPEDILAATNPEGPTE
jgi:hypothetical protein